MRSLAIQQADGTLLDLYSACMLMLTLLLLQN